ncbi:MAG: YHS domain-containing protein [Thaumarchaeota archaeon]|nr:YHS domain-containing protein [Nitrososphaerota archaeon]
MFGIFGGKKEKDVVCGMSVDPKKTSFKTEHQDVAYYFCSAHCKEQFEKEPAKYIGKSG